MIEKCIQGVPREVIHKCFNFQAGDVSTKVFHRKGGGERGENHDLLTKIEMYLAKKKVPKKYKI